MKSLALMTIVPILQQGSTSIYFQVLQVVTISWPTCKVAK